MEAKDPHLKAFLLQLLFLLSLISEPMDLQELDFTSINRIIYSFFAYDWRNDSMFSVDPYTDDQRLFSAWDLTCQQVAALYGLQCLSGNIGQLLAIRQQYVSQPIVLITSCH